MKNILIIGCGLLGSSLLRRISKKKIAKKIFIYEKSKSNIAKIKSLRLPGTIVKSLKDGLVNLDFADVETVMNSMGKAMMGTGEAEGEGRAGGESRGEGQDQS